MADYIPGSDTQFSAWVDQFSLYLTAHYLEFGFTIDDLDAFDAEHPIWDTALSTHVTAQTMAKSACSAKNATRAEFEVMIRSMAARINAWPTTTDAQREAFGIKSSIPSGAPGSTIPSDDKPFAIIDVSARLKHVMRVQNQTLTGTQKAKPANAIGCEVWRKIGEAPTGVADMEYVGLMMRNPYEMEYDSEEGGKMAHYVMRWVSSKGDKGSWSETESATIAA